MKKSVSLRQPEWTKKTVSLAFLREKALAADETTVVPWLKRIGVVPGNVLSMRLAEVRLDGDPKAIPAGYLASSAFEWDDWGKSRPLDFVKALSFEYDGSKRDLIRETLTALGRELAEAA